MISARVLILIPTIATTTLSVACRDSDAPSEYVHVDTLPGGILRTITDHPIDSGSWSLVRDRDIQPPELDSAELRDPQDLAIADDGSVLLVESKPTEVRIFSRAGQLVRSIGREGSGPGEFRSAFIALLGDTLVVQDPQNARATTFNWRLGTVLSERRTACCYFNPIGIDADGRAVVRSISRSPDTTLKNVQSFVRFPINGTTADTVFVPERQDVTPGRPWMVREGTLVRMAMTVPLQPRAHHQVDPTGAFVTGWSADYILRATTTGRDTVALFGRPAGNMDVTAADKQRIVDEQIARMRAGNRNGPSEAALRAAFDPSLIPDRRPAYETIAIDAAGRRWVRRTEPNAEAVRFDLFSRDSRWLDVLAVPTSGWPRSSWTSVAWGKNEVAVTLEGEDGRPLVRVYRLAHRGD